MGFIVHPSKWEAEHARAIFAGQAYQSKHDGQLPDTPMWRMLEFRHSLNPTRFEHWHPNVALILENRESGGINGALLSPPHGWIGHMRESEWSDAPAPPIQFAHTITGPPTSAPTTSAMEPPASFAVQIVPEPSAAIQGLAAVLLAAAYIANRLRRDAQARSARATRHDGIEALSPASQPVLQAAWKL